MISAGRFRPLATDSLVAFGGTGGIVQEELFMPLSPQAATTRSRDGWEFQLTEKEIDRLRKPIASSSGGYQSAMREAATSIFPGGKWKVSDQLMMRLFRMSTQQGKHGGYQGRLPMRVLTPVFITMRDQSRGTWFYCRHEAGDLSRVKFGHSDNPPKRIGRMSTDNPRRLIVAFTLWDPSGRYEEIVKKRFARFACNPKIRGQADSREWFQVTSEIRAFIDICQRVKTTDELPRFQ